MRAGLRLKLGIYVVLFLGAGLSAIGFFRLRAERQIYMQELEERGVALLRSFAIPCTTAMANNDTPALDNYIIKFANAAGVMELNTLAVLDFEGRVVAHTKREEYAKLYDDPFTRAATASPEPQMQHVTEGGRHVLEIAVPIVSGLRWGTLKASFTTERMEASLAARRRRTLTTGAIASVGAALIAYFLLSFLVMKPVLAMTAMTKRFGEGRLESRLDITSDDEMGQLGAHLNGMADQIQRYTGSLEKLVEARTSELVQLNDKLELLAQTDPLTGLFNRRHFMEKLEEELRRARRVTNPFSILMLDVDYFKGYNDRNGHLAGDAVLQQLAKLMRERLRDTDIVARYGGEEFIVLLANTDKPHGLETAKNLQKIVAETDFPNGELQPDGRLTVSVGVSTHPSDAAGAIGLIDCADQALYRSKDAGRNRATAYYEGLSA